jgi:hypothetical protein
MFESEGWWPAVGYDAYRYKPIDDDKEALAEDTASRGGRQGTVSRISTIASKALYAVLLVGAVYVSFHAGQVYEGGQQRANGAFNGALKSKLLPEMAHARVANPPKRSSDAKAVPTLPIQLEYNASFGDAPNPVTEAAWDNLLPKQGGFFQHPTIAPVRSDFAVFHQLHCLVSPYHPTTPYTNRTYHSELPSPLTLNQKQNGIRQAFWFTHSAASQGRRLTDADFPAMISPRHMSHCIDLLRQSLMCQPDLTVEVKDELGGVTGFGTVHQCKDWGRFMEWMGEWETYGQTEPYVAEEHHHHGHSLVGAM